MTLAAERLEGEKRDMRISVFSFFRGRAERKLNKIVRYCYGNNFTVLGIVRK